jgi:hypothetical protein
MCCIGINFNLIITLFIIYSSHMLSFLRFIKDLVLSLKKDSKVYIFHTFLHMNLSRKYTHFIVIIFQEALAKFDALN